MTTEGTEGYRDIFVTIAGITLGMDEALLTPEEVNVVHGLVNRTWDLDRASPGKQSLFARYDGLAQEHFKDRYAPPWYKRPNGIQLIGGFIELWIASSNGLRWLSQVGPGTHVAGIYDHFKGGVYRAFKVSSSATNKGAPSVDYMSMTFATDHTRECWQWNEIVFWPDGKFRSRFVYRGPDLYTPPPPFKVASPKLPYEDG